MARSITIATGKVAFTVSFPVEVLIKSDPKTKGKKKKKTSMLIKNLFLHFLVTERNELVNFFS